jgi:hypothetical protein
MAEKTLNLVNTDDIQIIIKHLAPVKAYGWGEVKIKVCNGNIVHIDHTESEEIKNVAKI